MPVQQPYEAVVEAQAKKKSKKLAESQYIFFIKPVNAEFSEFSPQDIQRRWAANELPSEEEEELRARGKGGLIPDLDDIASPACALYLFCFSTNFLLESPLPHWRFPKPEIEKRLRNPLFRGKFHIKMCVFLNPVFQTVPPMVTDRKPVTALNPKP